MGALEGTSFNTTSRLNSEVLFGIRETIGGNDLGEGALFGHSGRLRLGFDTAFTGEDALRVRLNGKVGHTDNVDEHIYDADSSPYAFIGGDIGGTLDNGPLVIIAGFGGGATYYSEDLFWREDDEHWVPDIYATLGGKYSISDSAVARLFARGYYGGQATLGREFIKPGVVAQNYFYWDLNFGADARFDGGALGQQGFEVSGDFNWGGVAQDDNSFGGDLDNFDIEFRVEGRYNFDQNSSLFIAGSYGFREFDEYHPMGLAIYSADSDNFRLGGGGRTQWGGVFSLAMELGVEVRDYEDVPLAGDDERTEFYINGDLNWVPTDAFSAGLYADYGIQNFNINEGPVDGLIDPLGLRSGLRAHYQWNETTSLTADCNLTKVHGSEVVDRAFDGWDFWRWGCGLSLNHMLNDRVELFADGEFVQLDDDFDDDTYLQGGIGARVGF